jgi:hypothetical protein
VVPVIKIIINLNPCYKINSQLIPIIIITPYVEVEVAQPSISISIIRQASSNSWPWLGNLIHEIYISIVYRESK